MHVGMLWYDNTPGVTLKIRIEKAANYYRQKYHQEPSMLEKNQPRGKGDADLPKIGSMTIRSYGTVLPGHLWIGIEDNN